MLTMVLFYWYDFIKFYFLNFLKIWKMTKISIFVLIVRKKFEDGLFNLGH